MDGDPINHLAEEDSRRYWLNEAFNRAVDNMVSYVELTGMTLDDFDATCRVARGILLRKKSSLTVG